MTPSQRTTRNTTTTTEHRRRRAIRAGCGTVALCLLAVACGSDDEADPAASAAPTAGAADTSSGTASTGDSITLVTYDSFPEADTSLNEALDAFTADTGIEVEILIAGDAGTMLAKAALTAGNPEGDVMFGVDNTLLSRAIDDEIFEPYVPAAVADGTIAIDEAFTALTPDGVATPVDYGDVCVNYDIGWFEERDIDPPASLDELQLDEYRDLLVVENPATSSPGLAFLLATIDQYGDDWPGYWSALRDNGVTVVDGWTQAYYEQFSATGGTSPLVVSYGSSPPAEVIFADPPRDDAPTGVIEDTCFRQVEFAGVLRGTESPDAARALVDFLVSEQFQRELPLNLFVYPTNEAVALPDEFVEFAVVPDEPRALDPAEIETNRADWIDEWTSLVLG